MSASPTGGRPSRAPRRAVVGTVVSDRMRKTIAVRVERKVRHPVYGKYVTRREVFKAHDEHGTAKKGDTVEIAWARRLSKTKFWNLVRVVAAARVEAVRGDEEIPSARRAPAAAPTPAGGEATS